MVFHYNEDESVTTLDPAFVKSQSEIWIVSQIFNGLVDLNPQLQVVPALSDHWEISEDKKIYTFYLRRDAQFCFPDLGGKVTHRRVNSHDVAFSLSGLSAGDGSIAGQGYERLVSRWRTVQAYESAI